MFTSFFPSFKLVSFILSFFHCCRIGTATGHPCFFTAIIFRPRGCADRHREEDVRKVTKTWVVKHKLPIGSLGKVERQLGSYQPHDSFKSLKSLQKKLKWPEVKSTVPNYFMLVLPVATLVQGALFPHPLAAFGQSQQGSLRILRVLCHIVVLPQPQSAILAARWGSFFFLFSKITRPQQTIQKNPKCTRDLVRFEVSTIEVPCQDHPQHPKKLDSAQ